MQNDNKNLITGNKHYSRIIDVIGHKIKLSYQLHKRATNNTNGKIRRNKGGEMYTIFNLVFYFSDCIACTFSTRETEMISVNVVRKELNVEDCNNPLTQ